MSIDLKDSLATFVKRVKDLSEHVRGNEQATKQSLVGPLFSLLGYDLTDPRECIPEFKTDFGIGRSVKPVDWAFMSNGRPIFFVEAKEAGKKLTGYSEQLADYFAKSTDVKLGVLTNGVNWKFYTDVDNPNVMDKEPFVTWDVLTDDEIPIDLLTVLHKSQYNPQLIRTFAERNRNRNLLVNELTRLLEPSADFIRLAITNIETRRITDSVIDNWKPVLKSAIEEWARQRTLNMVLNPPKVVESAQQSDRIVTTQEEIKTFEAIKEALGDSRPIAYQDTFSYFKIHLPERNTWAFCRLYLDRRSPVIWLALDKTELPEMGSISFEEAQAGWIELPLRTLSDIQMYGDLFRLAWDKEKALHPAK